MSSCRDCPNRKLGCHTGCEIYEAYRAEKMRIREAEKAAKQNIYALYVLRINGCDKARRRKGLKSLKYK